MSQYVAVDEQSRIIHAIGRVDPPDMQGPILPPPEPMERNGAVLTYHLWDSPISFAAPFPAAALLFLDGQPQWVETRTLDEVRISAIAGVDQFADAARLAVVGDAARIKEYERAQLGAEQYRDAGFSGPVPAAVSSWAYAKRREEWTAQQAAEDILAASARWYVALDGIRAMRLDAKETIRSASTGQEVAATAATFRANLTAAMQGVQ